MIFLAANFLGEDIRHLDDHALEQLEIEGLDDSAFVTELDCPMVDVMIQDSLIGMQPGVLIWEECGKQKYLRNCLTKAFFTFVLYEGPSMQVLDAVIDVEK